MSQSLRSKARSTSAIVLLVSLVTGCAIPPKASDLSQIKPVSDYQTEQSLKSSNASWPSQSWWLGYNDSQLNALIEEGLSDANSMKSAMARLQLATAATAMSRANLMPTIGAAASAEQQRQSYNYLIAKDFAPKGWNDAGLATLNFNWEIDFWGKNRAALAAAKGEEMAAMAEAAAAKLAVSSSIAQVYAQLTALYAERDATANALRVRQDTEKLIQSRYTQSLENEGALERARSSTQSTRAGLAAIDEQISLAKHQIAALLGKGPDRSLSIKRPHVRGGRFNGLPKNLPLDLLGRRPDIVAARLRADASDEHIKQAKAAFYPNINLAATIGKQVLHLDLLTDADSTFGSVGPAISLPILDGGRLRAGYRRAEASHQLAVATYDQTLVQALKEVADAVVSKRQLQVRYGATLRAAKAAENAYNVVKQRYNGGLATYLEVLAAEDAMIGARSAAAALRARSFALDVQLVRALGGGFRNTEKTK